MKCDLCSNLRIVNEDLKGKLAAAIADNMEKDAQLKVMHEAIEKIIEIRKGLGLE